MKTLIVGAGMSGAACADLLEKAGHQVTVFDRATRVGGRLYTRHLPWADLDLGAQYFTAREPLFKTQVDNWHQSGIVQLWQPTPWLTDNYNSHPSPDRQARYIGFKNAQAPVVELLSSSHVYLQQHVEKVSRKNNQWYAQLSNHTQSGPYDTVVMALPLPLAADLFDETLIQTFDLPDIEVQATQVLAVQLATPIKTEMAWSFVKDRPIDYLGQVSAKPNRNANGQTWLMHFTDGATQMYKYNATSSFVKLGLLQLEQIFSDNKLGECVNHYSYHHPYARICSKNIKQSYYWQAEYGVGFCGDWCQAGRIEGAFLSGRQLAQRILNIQ
ncbi:NAD(P)/FAD-dependent oxidoreductase [Catenovulum adriaticum]|uniref:FAD-dependent oxidoreductase n=1 Tax=Catenovulum adriaticum TaxID=2984846 RepID=A0ABY7AJV1_9ALTE|nr:FAD-dependent oxidoreductase [Catenovulum sp. TS8]WAJ69503.1 FAD-dependent oxidoreductase [Catenovulum sp. TS8]